MAEPTDSAIPSVLDIVDHDDVRRQMLYDMRWRMLALDCARQQGVLTLYATSALRGVLHVLLWRWQTGVIDEQEFVTEMQEILDDELPEDEEEPD